MSKKRPAKRLSQPGAMTNSSSSQASPVLRRKLFPDPSRRFTRAVLGALLRDLSHINIRLPGIVSLSTSRGDFNMRKFILIAGFVLASAAAQAGDRSLSLGGGETTTVTAPAKAAEGSRIVEAPPAAEAPKYIERPAAVEPKPETSKTETSKPETSNTERARPRAAKMQRYATRPASAGPGRPSAQRAALMSRSAGSHRMRYGIRARIISALYRHGIYW